MTDIDFQGRKLKEISLKQAGEMDLEKAGSASAVNMTHSLYLMAKYCKNSDKVKYYTIEVSVQNTETGEERRVVTFWMEKG